MKIDPITERTPHFPDGKFAAFNIYLRYVQRALMDCKSVTRGFDSHSPLAKNAGYPEKVTSVFLLGHLKGHLSVGNSVFSAD